MLDWFDEPSGQQLFDFYLDLHFDFRMKIPSWLHDRLCAKLDIQSVADLVWIQAGHFLVAPGEHISEFF